MTKLSKAQLVTIVSDLNLLSEKKAKRLNKTELSALLPAEELRSIENRLLGEVPDFLQVDEEAAAESPSDEKMAAMGYKELENIQEHLSFVLAPKADGRRDLAERRAKVYEVAKAYREILVGLDLRKKADLLTAEERIESAMIDQ